MTDAEKREAARLFCQKWKNKGKEDEDDQKFWIEILQNILGVEKPTDYIEFQKKVIVDGNTKRIDAYIPETRVIIEQKSLGISLDKKGSQSGGIELTPYEQAKRYNDNLPYDEKARWIITSNFAEIWVYDMNMRVPKPLKFVLDSLKDLYHCLDFLVNRKEKTLTEEVQLSIEAGEIIAKIYKLFLRQYKDPNSDESLKSLNKLCVRLVFCMYAEDSGLFPGKNYFQKYTQKYTGSDYRKSIIEVFKILNISEDSRDPYIDEELNLFPYVSGGLFNDDDIEIPRIDDELRDTLKTASDFDWSQISPTIFGAVFESTLNPETRRAGGMHYTSLENIHKVIDPLFLDDLKKEFEDIKAIAVGKDKTKALLKFQQKLSNLKFLDPACGSGNFLTETYVCLRRLENEIIRILHNGQMFLGIDEGKTNPIKVSIGQFYGIEINDFAVTVARTALWIAESQMMKETEDIVLNSLNFLPLKTKATIVEANALRIDWEEVVPKSELNYIMGNPPFVGYSLQNKNQKDDILSVYVDEKGKPYKTAGKIDYVSSWYFKASQYITPLIKVAFVSTNSITQGEQVAAVWKPLYDRFNIDIDFAHRTFKWDSEASDKAAVHCVIVGFSRGGEKKITSVPPTKTCPQEVGGSGFGVAKNERGLYSKRLYENNKVTLVSRINPYLIEGNTVFIESRKKPLCDVPEMVYGNKPTDGGFLFLTEQEKIDFITKEPISEKYIRQILGSEEYINNKKRYCLWLKNANPADLRKSQLIMDRVEGVKQARLQSPKEATRKSAETPTLFQEIRQPETEYIIVPRVSSENRRYVPIGFIKPEIIVNDSVQIIPEATLYHFGVLTSNVHMSWMRVVCGRLKSDYRYSKDIVYNNFPWPTPTTEQKAKIEATAQGILSARAKYPDCSLADLYDPLTMPPELKKAHEANDKAVMEAYGMNVKTTSESDCVSFLMNLYKELTSKKG